MQTKEQVIAKIDTMLPELIANIKKRANSLSMSGGIDLSVYTPDDFTPAKILLTVILKDEADQYMPFSKEGKAIVKNLQYF